MSNREQVPGDRDGAVAQDVAEALAAITLPSIEPFTSDAPALAGLPARCPFPVPVPEPLTRRSVAQGVYDAGIRALGAVKVLEDALAACKAGIVDRVMGAARVEAEAGELDQWQNGVAQSSAVSNMALVLRIPEVTASSLVYHSMDLREHFPDTMAALGAGELSWRHACTVADEIGTLRENPDTTDTDVAVFEAKLLLLAVGTTAGCFASKARRARESMFPGTIVTRTKQAFAARKMVSEPGKDNMSWMTFYLPTVTANAIMTRCTRIARAVKEDARQQQEANDHAGGGEDSREYRTLTQLRVDIAAIQLLGQELPTTTTTFSRPVSFQSTSQPGPTASSVGSAGNSGNNGGDASGTRSSGAFFSEGVSFGPTPVFGTGSDRGVTLIDEEPSWAHKFPENDGNQREDPPHGAQTPAVDVPLSGALLSNASTNKDTGACRGTDGEPIAGVVMGDGSGFVDGMVDGIVEDAAREYLEQLEQLAQGRIIQGPPLPEATILLKVPFLGLLDITDEPAELVGVDGGPVPEDIARKLLAGSSTFLRVLTDPVSGEVLPLTPERYTLRNVEKEMLRAMAESCYFPNCMNPVMDTEFDHLHPFEKGGKSTAGNLRPACRRHHVMKHFKDDKDRHGNYRRYKEPHRQGIRLRGWTPQPLPDGRVGWITPTGAYEPPQYEEPQRTMYPTWLKKRIAKSLTPRPPDEPKEPESPGSHSTDN